MEHNQNQVFLQQDSSSEDYLKAIIQHVMQQGIEVAFAKHIGAGPYERTDQRSGQRNGHYEREYHTRVGTLRLRVCRDREGKFSPAIFERYQRSEKALVDTIVQMYFSGVSTRKVQDVLNDLCGVIASKSHVSDLVKQVDVVVQAWRDRPLIKPYRYTMFDARYEHVRENGHVVSKAFVVAIGISEEGMREIIGCYVIDSESEEGWSGVMTHLKNRGLDGVTYAVADDNKGLRKALIRHFQGVVVQRCQVHFMRNLIGKLSKSERFDAVRLLQDVFDAHTKEDALERGNKLQQHLMSIGKPVIARWIDSDLEQTLGVYLLPASHRKKMRSTNMLERLNQELKRRSRVVRIFPNSDSCLRLLSAICQETSEDWASKQYLNTDV